MKIKMKNYTNLIKLLLHFILRKLGYRIHKIGGGVVFDFENFLYRYLNLNKKLTFIQIGANDGKMNDPIYNFNMKNKSFVSGFVLEPLPDMYEKLVANYKSCPNVKGFNLAIHTTESEMIIHRVKPSLAKGIPAHAAGIGSFNKDHWKKSNFVTNQEFIEQVRVSCVSFNDFVESNKIENIDLLLLDTEGYDYEILMNINFQELMPKIIRFEHGIRDQVMSLQKFKHVCDYLNKMGYQIVAESYDVTAYLLDPNDLLI
jgi:FkbM family methyltransferase